MVEFQFDKAKCILPYNKKYKRPIKCLKCLEICPKSLLMFRPFEEREKNGAPIQYEIHMSFKSYGDKFCPECMKCVNICPSNALKIRF